MIRIPLLLIVFWTLETLGTLKSQNQQDVPLKAFTELPVSLSNPELHTQKNWLYKEVQKNLIQSKTITHFAQKKKIQISEARWTQLACTDEPENHVYFCQLPITKSDPLLSTKKQSLFFQVDAQGQLVRKPHSLRLACTESNCEPSSTVNR